MSAEQTIHPAQAGVDTTTGHGVDSFFYAEGRIDPWASHCMALLVDTIINHEHVLYPLWSRNVTENIEDRLLPLSFVEGSKHNLLRIVTKVSADEVRLSNDVLKKELRNFTDWANINAQDVAGWVRYHRESPRIVEIHHIAKSTWAQADKLWKRRNREELRQRTGLSDADLNFAYETFIRAIQYHHILGEAVPYVSHPLRNRAFRQIPIILKHQDQWSWGRYFTELINDERAPKDIKWLLGEVAEVRDLTRKYNATWYVLGKLPRKNQMELVSAIAAESNLPAKLKDSTHKAIKLALGAGAVLGAAIPILGIVLGLGVVAVEMWRGDLPGVLGKVPIFKGQLVWPGLLTKS